MAEQHDLDADSLAHSRLPQSAIEAPGRACARTVFRTQLDGEDNERLMTFSRPAMESLHQQLNSPYLTVLLANQRGAILGMVGNEVAITASLSPEEPPRPASGTAAPVRPTSSAAAGGAVTLPPQLPAFPVSDRLVIGIATPIDAVCGGVLGIIDSAPATGQGLGLGVSHTQALLQMTAEMIERRLIEHDERGFLLLRFHARPDMLGTPFEGLAVFDHDSRLVASNRPARAMLCLPARPANPPCRDCFETQWPGLVGYAALCTREPFQLKASMGGAHFFARASLR